MLEDWTRRRAARRVEGGDDRPLQPFRWWHLLAGRKLLYLPASPAEGRDADYAVDIRHWGKQGGEEGARAHLYRDGKHRAQSRLPAGFPVEGGTLEVAMSDVGLKRARYVTEDGARRQLTPDPRSAVGRRLRFDREHPVAGRWIGAVSVLLLLVGVGLNLLQIAEPVSEIPPIAESIGTFESPVRLPLWLNVTLGIGAALGSMERGLRLRYHWLLDGAGA
ncbi:hypothetical protein NBM05_14185 [Rothia sp. AR01]|uniref:Uncharacterized protein n=1 Tax=Rothia santali TaxID=2949643 RepID=A0A9X2HLG6_9MICC|nr:hypothetical protein [Rothia santali]MCP3427128.1 hypothetical protein [Rothia santali]